VANKSDIRAVVEERLLAINNCRFGLQSHLWYTLLSTKTKTMLYKTLTCLVILYGFETWTILRTEEKRIKGKDKGCKNRMAWACHTNNETFPPKLFLFTKPYVTDKYSNKNCTMV
jgi:hypothetical protein